MASDDRDRLGDDLAQPVRVEIGFRLREERPAVRLREGQRPESLAVNPGVALGGELSLLLIREQELERPGERAGMLAGEGLVGGREIRQAAEGGDRQRVLSAPGTIGGL